MKIKSLNAVFLGLVILFSGWLGGCQEPGPDPLPRRQSAYLHFLHGSPQVDRIDLQLSNLGVTTTLARNIEFGEGWPAGGYIEISLQNSADSGKFAGLLSLVDSRTQMPLLSNYSLNFAANTYHSLILFDSLGTSLLARTTDDIKPAPPGKAFVRVMNLSPSFPIAGLDIPGANQQLSGVSYLTYSSFSEIEVGTHTVYFVNPGSGTIYDSVPGWRFRPGLSYNALLLEDNFVPLGFMETLE